MAIYTKHRIDLVAATDGNSYAQKIFERETAVNDISRDDLVSSFQGTVTVLAGQSKSFALSETDLQVIRMIYVESTNPVTFSLLDDINEENVLLTLELAGPRGSGPCKLFSEIRGFVVNKPGTSKKKPPSPDPGLGAMVFRAGIEDTVVTFALFGDTSSASAN